MRLIIGNKQMKLKTSSNNFNYNNTFNYNNNIFFNINFGKWVFHSIMYYSDPYFQSVYRDGIIIIQNKYAEVWP